MSATTIQSNGQGIHYQNGDVEMRVGAGQYTAESKTRRTSHDSNGTVQSGTTKNEEYTGNAQESYAGHGVTSQYSMRVVGSPQMFSGRAQRAADKCVSKLVGLLLQPGDDRYSATPEVPALPNFAQVVSNMSSSWSSSLMPAPPQITRIQDIGKLAAYMGTYIQTVSLENSAYQAAQAGLLQVEREMMQQKETLKRLKKTFQDGEFSPSQLSGSPASDDRTSEPNIDRKTVYEQIMDRLPQLLANEGEIG